MPNTTDIKKIKLTNNQQTQIDHYFLEFIKLSNKFFEDGNKPLHEYWKGQVFGMCKVMDVMDADFNSSYYLSQLI